MLTDEELYEIYLEAGGTCGEEGQPETPGATHFRGQCVACGIRAVYEAGIAHGEARSEECPEWLCPDLSTEDRRDGKTCPDHPCTCEPDDREETHAQN